jgi:hypothetical protein
VSNRQLYHARRTCGSTRHPISGSACSSCFFLIVRVAATIAGDPEVSDRVKFAETTVAKFAADPTARLTGGPKLADIIGEPVVARLRSWLKLSADVTAIEEMNAKHFWVRMAKDDVIGREDTANGEVVFHPPGGRISGEPIPRSSSCNGGAAVL